MVCEGKKTLAVLQGVWEPLVVELSFPGDLTDPPTGRDYVVEVRVDGPDGSGFTMSSTTGAVTVVGPNSVRFDVDTRDGGFFNKVGFYNFRVFVKEVDEADPSTEYQVWGAEADSCLYVYEKSPCPEGPCDG